MLWVDYSHCLKDRIGALGLGEDEILEPSLPALDPVYVLGENRHGWPLGWYDLPERRPAHELIKDIGAEINAKANHLLVLGIGGSALGSIALRASLNPPRANEIAGNLKLHVLDNVDPRLTAALLPRLDPARTYVNVITKSGGTLETMANFFAVLARFREKLFPEEVARRFIATTDPEKGLLRKLARELRFRTLPVPPDVGGRFSVLSAVGLLPAAATGVDIDALLDGALEMRDVCTGSEADSNPALLLAEIHYKFNVRRALRVPVMFAYSDGLYPWADWWRQIWAESLGKKLDIEGVELSKPAGTTPVKALGTTDQHSQVQLYAEGPPDKLFFILRQKGWESSPGKIEVPEGALKQFGYLNNLEYGEIIAAECEATIEALADAGRPVCQIVFPELDAYHVGQFIMLWELATAYSGILYGIDPFDQPGVEAGKIAAKRILGGRD